MKRYAAAAAVVLLNLSLCASVQAEVVTEKDPNPKCSQRPALDVKRATFNYGDEKFVWRIKMGALSKKRTRVFGRYTLGTAEQDRYDVMVTTKFDKDGDKRVVGYWSDYVEEDYSNRFTNGITAEWDWDRDLIVLTLTSHLRGKRARAYAYSVEKGALHGPPCGDYIASGRIDRG